jgi:hypothetical protein
MEIRIWIQGFAIFIFLFFLYISLFSFFKKDVKFTLNMQWELLKQTKCASVKFKNNFECICKVTKFSSCTGLGYGNTELSIF